MISAFPEDDQIAKELASIGLAVKSVYDLVNTRQSYPEAIPILLKWLDKGIESKNIEEGVVRALTAKEAKGVAGKILFKAFYRRDEPAVRWVIGNAFTVVVMPDDLEEIIEIVENKEYGMSRQMFVLALGKLKGDRAEETLLKRLKEGDLVLHVISALGTLKSLAAEKYLIPYLDSSHTATRKAAESALKKISKAKEKKSKRR